MLSLLRLLTYVLLVSGLYACGKQSDNNQILLSGETMGTTYSIKITNISENLKTSHIHNEIDVLLNGINNIMSTYEKNSELSLLNQNHSGECIPLSKELLDVLKEAIRISKLSDGAFDVTVGPLVNLWGFGPDAIPDSFPSDEMIQSKLTDIGYKQIELSETNQCIKKNNDEIYIDLSAIAKGYAVDRLAHYLELQSLENFMVEIGGEVRAKGKNGEQEIWRIGIEKPLAWSDSIERTVYEIISLNDLSMATSGDYRNYYEKNGQRYSHTINPMTGKPITHKLASVTVVHQSSMTADALATALNVLGYEKGLLLANKENLSVLFIMKEDDGFRDYATESFQQLTIH